MITKRYTCEILTPMFPGTARAGEAWLDEKSVRSGIAFWWRAIQDKNNTTILREEEKSIFGSSKGAGKFSLEIIPPKEDPLKAPFNKENLKTNDYCKKENKSINIFNYLAYGPIFNDKIKTAYYAPGNCFEIIFRIYERDIGAFEKITHAVELFSVFGGIGSRSRNMMGSFRITGYPEGYEPKGLEGIFKEYKKGVIKNYTAFSVEAQLLVAEKTFKTWEEALFFAGAAYREARCGNNLSTSKKVGIDVRHDISYRRFISSPANTQSVAGITRVHRQLVDRHAKSLFMGLEKIDKQGDDLKYKPYFLFLPYRYLESYDKRAKQKNPDLGYISSLSSTTIYEQLIEGYNLAYIALIDKLSSDFKPI